MGYVVQTNDGFDLYETAVSVETHNVSGSTPAYLYLKDAESLTIAIYYPGQWKKVGISTALSKSLSTESMVCSMPSGVLTVLNGWLENNKDNPGADFDVVNYFVENHS